MIQKKRSTWCCFLSMLLVLCIVSEPSFGFASTLFERSESLLKTRAAEIQTSDYSFVVLGDSRSNERVFIAALAAAKRCNPLFILHTGDYSLSGTLEETERFLALLQKNVPQIPFFVVVGNHENRRIFTQFVGPKEFHLDLPRHGRFVAIDNSGYAVSSQQINYLKSQLSVPHTTAFVAFHIPPATERWPNHSFTEGAGVLTDVLAQVRADKVFCGHIHMFDRDTIKGVPYLVSGGAGAPLVGRKFSGESIHHILVVRVHNGKVSEEIVKVVGDE